MTLDRVSVFSGLERLAAVTLTYVIDQSILALRGSPDQDHLTITAGHTTNRVLRGMNGVLTDNSDVTQRLELPGCYYTTETYT